MPRANSKRVSRTTPRSPRTTASRDHGGAGEDLEVQDGLVCVARLVGERTPADDVAARVQHQIGVAERVPGLVIRRYHIEANPGHAANLAEATFRAAVARGRLRRASLTVPAVSARRERLQPSPSVEPSTGNRRSVRIG